MDTAYTPTHTHTHRMTQLLPAPSSEHVLTYETHTHLPTKWDTVTGLVIKTCDTKAIRKLHRAMAANNAQRAIRTLVYLSGWKLSTLLPMDAYVQLHTLELHQMRTVTDISALAACQQLRTLVLRLALVLEDIGPIGKLPNLTKLVLHTPAVRAYHPLQHLTALVSLMFYRCTLVTHLALLELVKGSVNLSNLQVVDCPQFRLPDQPFPFSALTMVKYTLPKHTDLPAVYNAFAHSKDTLQKFSFAGSAHLQTLGPVSQFNQLRELNLTGTKIKELSVLSTCTQLKVLNLSSIKGIRSLPRMQVLRTLIMRDTCSQPIVDGLPTHLPLLQTLDIRANVYTQGVHGAHAIRNLVPVLGCPSLTHLDLTNVDSIRKRALACFWKTERSAHLKLHTNVIVNPAYVNNAMVRYYVQHHPHDTDISWHRSYELYELPPFLALNSVQVLNISGTQIRCLTPLQNLPHLRELVCCDGQGLSAPIQSVAPLVHCLRLERVDIRRCNQLTTVVPLLRLYQTARTLRWADVRGCDNVPAADIRQLVRTLPTCIQDATERSEKVVYYTHFNGGYVFKVTVHKLRVSVFHNIESDEMNPTQLKLYNDGGGQLFESKPFYCKQVDSVFVGRSPLNQMTEFSGGTGVDLDGNSILVCESETTLEYCFIGAGLYSFVADHKIEAFVSPVGNNDVPYPYATATGTGTGKNTHEYYLMSDRTVCAGMPANCIDPYQYLFCMNNSYDRPHCAIRAIGSNTIKKKSFSQFHSGIHSITIGNESHVEGGVDPDPERTYDELMHKAIRTRKQHAYSDTDILSFVVHTKKRSGHSSKPKPKPNPNQSRSHKNAWWKTPFRTPYEAVASMLGRVSFLQHINCRWNYDIDATLCYVLLPTYNTLMHSQKTEAPHPPPHIYLYRSEREALAHIATQKGVFTIKTKPRQKTDFPKTYAIDEKEYILDELPFALRFHTSSENTRLLDIFKKCTPGETYSYTPMTKKTFSDLYTTYTNYSRIRPFKRISDGKGSEGKIG